MLDEVEVYNTRLLYILIKLSSLGRTTMIEYSRNGGWKVFVSGAHHISVLTDNPLEELELILKGENANERPIK